MSISRRNNRALNRVLRDSLRSHTRAEPPPQEAPAPDTPAYTLCADIPESYDDSYVRAIPKDPQNTFVYWELPKGRAMGSLFADKGTAHVGNDEAVRIGQQLNESRRREAADSCRGDDGGYQQHHRGADNYHQVNWDNGNQYNFDGNNRQHHHSVDNYNKINWDNGNQYGVDNYHHVNWDNGNQYNFDGNNQQHHNGVDGYHQVNNDYHQINWDNGNQYNFDGNNQQHHHGVDNYNHVNWDNGNQYDFDGNNQHRHGVDDYHRVNNGYHQVNWDNGGQYSRDDVYRHLQHIQHSQDDGAAFSEMLEALIERCGRYIADYRQSEGGPLDRAMSSGLLRGLGEEPRT